MSRAIPRFIATPNIAFFRRHFANKVDEFNKKQLLFLATSLSIMAHIQRKKKRCYWTRIETRHVEHSMSTGARTGDSSITFHAVFHKPEYRLTVFRMTEQHFDYLLNLVSPIITKQDTLIYECISATERLQMTLSDWLIYTARVNQPY